MARLTTLPENSFLPNVVVDDAVYYAVPAIHFWQGKGFSFDQVHKTNGVQPLWALTTVGLARMTSDRVTLLRAMVAISGCCWIVGGLVLFIGLRRLSTGAAVLIATGWMLTGFWNRMAFQGMENGLHGLILASIIAFCARLLNPPTVSPLGKPSGLHHLLSLTVLGLLCSLFTLTRLDSALLPLILGIAIWLGWLNPEFKLRLLPRLDWAGALLFSAAFGLPLALWLLTSYVYFGDPFPISGKVKLFYFQTWKPIYANIWAALKWHASYLVDITAEPVIRNTDETMFKVFYRGGFAAKTARIWHWALGLGAVLALLSYGVAAVRRRIQVSAWHIFLAALTLFILAHFVMDSWMLQHFTSYCTWYLAPECLALWLVYGFCFNNLWRIGAPLVPFKLQAASLRTASDITLSIVAILITGMAAFPVGSPPALDPRTTIFVDAGRWMNKHFPAGAHIAAYSAGFQALFAENHRVFNLDGLISNRDYLERYLRPGRIPDYLRDEQIDYFADYTPLRNWESFFPPLDMRRELVRWWREREGPDGQPLAFCIWRLKTARAARADSVVDRLSQIQYEAEVQDRYPVVEEADLQKYLASHPAQNWRVVTSVFEPSSGGLQHVLVPAPEAATLGINAGNIDLEQRSNAHFDEALELIGWTVSSQSVPRGGALALTRAWRLLKTNHGLAQTDFEISLELKQPARPAQQTSPCVIRLHDCGAHGTYPVERWNTQEAIVETHRLKIPEDAPPGDYALVLSVRDPIRGLLLCNVHSDGDNSPALFLANVNVR